MSKELPKQIQDLNDYLLEIAHNDDAMLLSELDGFLAGIVVCPDLIRPSEWIPFIWGEEEPIFESEQHAQSVLSLVMFHYNDIIARLNDGTYCPIYDFDFDDVVVWDLWASGFWCAVLLRPDAWIALGEHDDEQVQYAALVLSRLAELADLPELQLEPMEMDEELELHAPDLIPECVTILHQARLAPAKSFATTANENRPKVGRNDPCPCGSGKKYKKCCLN